MMAKRNSVARRGCRHCGASFCQVHCPGTTSGRHRVDWDSVQIAHVDADVHTALIIVEFCCTRCEQWARALLDEKAFTWNGD